MGFENRIEIASPMRRRFEQIGGVIFNRGIRKAFSAGANGGLRNVGSGSAKTPSSELLRVIAEAAANDQCRFSGGLLRLRYPETDEIRMGTVVHPGRDGLPCFTLTKLRTSRWDHPF